MLYTLFRIRLFSLFCQSAPLFNLLLRSESPRGKCAKLRTVAASNNRNHTPRSLTFACSHHRYVVLFFAHIPFVVNRAFSATPAERFHQHPSFLQRTAPIVRSFCKGFTQHDLQILVTAPFCSDRKARAASAQSCTLWKQATIEITRGDHSIIACSHHIYVVSGPQPTDIF